MPWNPNAPYNELPLLPPDGFVETPVVFRQTTKSRVALESLRQAVNLIPNNEILIQTIPILEAKSSSEIENIVTTTDALFRYIDADSSADPATKEALRYRKALWTGINSLKRCPLSYRTMSEVCSALRDAEIGVRTQPGTYIGTSFSHSVIYTPPSGESVILDKIYNLSEFLHSDDDMDPLVKMAIAHYQFEAIHPFSDGNGRTGRVLNILFLVEKGLLDQPVLYLSKYIIENKADYYKALLNVTKKKAWEEWILFMLKAVECTATWTKEKVNAIVSLERQTIEYIRSINDLNKIYSRELIDLIFQRPYCRSSTLVDANVAQRQTAMKYLKIMSEYGILMPFNLGREKLFINTRLMDLLASDSHQFTPFGLQNN